MDNREKRKGELTFNESLYISVIFLDTGVPTGNKTDIAPALKEFTAS